MAQNSNGSAKRGPGRPFRPGQSGNPGGRPGGLAEAARLALKGDGRELLHIMLTIARGETLKAGAPGEKRQKGQIPTIRDRIEAVKWLADRGWGKATQVLEHSVADAKAKEKQDANRFAREMLHNDAARDHLEAAGRILLGADGDEYGGGAPGEPSDVRDA